MQYLKSCDYSCLTPILRIVNGYNHCLERVIHIGFFCEAVLYIKKAEFTDLPQGKQANYERVETRNDFPSLFPDPCVLLLRSDVNVMIMFDRWNKIKRFSNWLFAFS